MELAIVVFLAGFIYGFVNPGRESKIRLLKNSIIAGFVLGFVIALVFIIFTIPAGYFIPVIPIFGGILGFFAGILIAFFFGIVFMIGAFAGDVLESLLKR